MSSKKGENSITDNEEKLKAEEPQLIENKKVCEDETEDLCEINKLIEEAEKNKEEIRCLTEEVARARADFYNYRTRVERDREKDRKFAAEKSIDLLLPVFENLERVCMAVEDRESGLYKGVSMVTKQFFDAMLSLGLHQIETEGEFDPSLHEVVSIEEVEEKEKDGHILAVVRKGYKLAGRVIKAAEVKIGKYNENTNNSCDK